MISPAVPHGLKHKSADIPRSQALQAQLLGLESVRKKLSNHWQTMADSALAECSLLNQIATIASHEEIDGVVQRLIARLRDEAILTEGAEQESTRPPLTVVGTKPFSPVLAEGTN